MRLLLDTHAVLWWLAGDDRLPGAVRDAVEDPSIEALVSVASVWEIVIKEAAGRFRMAGGTAEILPRALREDGFGFIPVELRHALRVGALPPLHGNPFDRMLVAQAFEDGLTIVTNDRAIQAYPVDFVW